MARTIVVGVDFSDESRHAMDAAVALAKDTGAQLVLVHAFSQAPGAPDPTNVQVPDPIAEVQGEIDMDEAGDRVELDDLDDDFMPKAT